MCLKWFRTGFHQTIHIFNIFSNFFVKLVFIAENLVYLTQFKSESLFLEDLRLEAV